METCFSREFLWGKLEESASKKIYYISSQLGLVLGLEGAGCTTQPQQEVHLERKQWHPTVHPKREEMVQRDTMQQEGFSSTN